MLLVNSMFCDSRGGGDIGRRVVVRGEIAPKSQSLGPQGLSVGLLGTWNTGPQGEGKNQ